MIKRAGYIALSIYSFLALIIPENVYSDIALFSDEILSLIPLINRIDISSINLIVNKLIVLTFLFIVSILISNIYGKFRKVTIDVNGYFIIVEYGDILKAKGQKVISFDELFTTKIGNAPADIKESSICGQYLKANKDITDEKIQELLNKSGVKPCKRKSDFENRDCYKPGTMLQNGNDLLMSFAMLDEHGRAKKISFDQYIACLNNMWKEINKYYNHMDVYVPVLGSGLLRFENGSYHSLSKAELIDCMICSYKISSNKINANNKLHIVCKKDDDFSMDSFCEKFSYKFY